MTDQDDITPELRFLLLSLGFTGKEIDQLQQYVCMHSIAYARPTARAFKGNVFGQPIKRRLPRSDKRHNAEPAVLVYTTQNVDPQKSNELTAHGLSAMDPWWPLRRLAQDGKTLDLNQIPR